MAKVLVADDSIAVRKVAERHLTEAGLEVTLAANGEEAVAMLSQEQPDVIICDVIMPDKSGYDVCTYTRAQESLAQTPFLLISGIVNDEVTRQAESCGANGVLKKPFQGASLKEQVFDLLAKGQNGEADSPDSAPEPALSQKEPSPAEPSPALEQALAQVKELKAALAKEQKETAKIRDERANEASEQLKRHEQSGERVEELETLLAKECEQTAQLSQRLGEVEPELVEAKAKQEELSEKLSQIAKLCGQ